MNYPRQTLYHYTSLTGIIEILTKKKLWATNIMYMNDTKELLYTVELSLEVINEMVDIHDNKVAPFITWFINNVDKLSKYSAVSLYVTSFSEKCDLLSQWRGYCPSGIGFNLGLYLEPPYINNVERQGFKIIKCEYNKEKQKRIIQEYIIASIDKYRNILSEDTPLGEEAILSFNVVDLFEIALRLKHPAFEEEQEWRLFSRPITFYDKRIKYRAGKTTIIPYLEIDLSNADERLEIPEIWIWPNNNMSKVALEGLLIEYGIIGPQESTYYNNEGSHIKIPSIKMSTIPYRTI